MSLARSLTFHFFKIVYEVLIRNVDKVNEWLFQIPVFLFKSNNKQVFI